MAELRLTKEQQEKYRLVPFLSPLGAWSYGVGTAIGWGSFVVTSNQYLLQAGPLGSVIGMLAGSLIMLVVARCYAFLMRRYPSSGGGYTYARHVLGNDHGFLIAWFLGLTYMAVFWANATSVPLFARYFIGDTFKFGLLYTIFDYKVYLGEVMLTMAAIALAGILCTGDKRLKERIMIFCALVFTAGILVCTVGSLVLPAARSTSASPLLLPDASVLSQITKVALMTPWAFIGFESISHSTEEFTFSPDKSFPLLCSVVGGTSLLYILVLVLSVSAYPPAYDSWLAYLSDLGNLQGIEALPPFYAAYAHMGQAGVSILMAALLALVTTSLIGNVVALSRLMVALARDQIIPESYSTLNAKGTPQRSVLLIAALSLPIPLLGRTAIGWIVDITTIGAVIVYGMVCAAARSAARLEKDRLDAICGSVGVAVMVLFGAITFIPNLFADGDMAQETYFLLTMWAILGFLSFRVILNRDETNSMGRSTIVWVALLSLVLFSATVWMHKADRAASDQVFSDLRIYFARSGNSLVPDEGFIEREMSRLNAANLRSTLIAVGMFVLATYMMISNYIIMNRRQERSERELGTMREVAYRDPLTGVKSKAAFQEEEQQFNDRISLGTATPFAVVVCDVNGLKFINDTLGHKAGDDYIRQACRIVCAHFKRSPVYRIGGDEFVAILEEGGDLEERGQLLAAFDREVESNIGTTNAVVSAGMSVFEPGRDTTFHEVFERADALMYQRKMQLKAMGAATRD